MIVWYMIKRRNYIYRRTAYNLKRSHIISFVRVILVNSIYVDLFKKNEKFDFFLKVKIILHVECKYIFLFF